MRPSRRVLGLALALALGACANDFDVFNPVSDGGVVTDGGGGDGSSGSASGDSSSGGSSSGGSSSGGSSSGGRDAGTCTPDPTCLHTAETCASTCQGRLCAQSCEQKCNACLQAAGCPSPNACANATN